MKKVFVGNLPFKMRGKELRELFETFGNIEDSTVILERENKRRSRGFGFVTFENDEDADKAIAEMNGKEHEGRALTVNEADNKE